MRAEKKHSIERLPFALTIQTSEGVTLNQSKSKTNIYFWTVSLAVHIMIVVLAIIFAPVQKTSDVQQSSLQTYLVKAKPRESMSVDETHEDVIAEKIESIPSRNEELSQNNKPNAAEPNQTEPQLEITSEVIMSKDINESIQGVSIRERVTKALLQQHIKDQELRLGEQSAQSFRKEKTHPNISPETRVNTWEIPDAMSPTLVDCQNPTKKTLAIVASFTGGNIGCMDNSDFQKFIDKHKNKGVVKRTTKNNK